MVTVEEETEEIKPSRDRLLDAQEIEDAAENATRSSVKLQLQALATKLRKESQALERVEKSKLVAASTASNNASVTTSSKSPAVASTPEPASAPPATGSVKYSAIDRFSFDAGGYDSKFITLYVPLPGVGLIPKDQVTCDFNKDSFDLVVSNLKGKSYRLCKSSLEKDIDPSKCKIIVKAEKVVIKLAKIKGEFGYDHWSKLTDDKKSPKSSKSSDPSSSIMDLMKNMYDDGDDNMKKMIGETMMKQQRGELGDGMGGMGAGMGAGDMGI